MKTFVPLLLIVLIVFVKCSKDSQGSKTDAGTGKGGSLARFTIVGNYLYIVDNLDLKSFDISTPNTTQAKSSVSIGFEAETIFPFKGKLFIGSRDGMFIYSIEDPANPTKLGEARHVRSCDPVVANDSISYITLRGNRCGPAEDGLYVYDIKNINEPVQKSFLSIHSPLGLGLQDTVVFICQEDEGLTAVNVKDPNHPQIMYNLRDESYKDVIPYDNLLICYVKNGLVLYDMSDLNQLVRLGSSGL